MFDSLSQARHEGLLPQRVEACRYMLSVPLSLTLITWQHAPFQSEFFQFLWRDPHSRAKCRISETRGRSNLSWTRTEASAAIQPCLSNSLVLESPVRLLLEDGSSHQRGFCKYSKWSSPFLEPIEIREVNCTALTTLSSFLTVSRTRVGSSDSSLRIAAISSRRSLASPPLRLIIPPLLLRTKTPDTGAYRVYDFTCLLPPYTESFQLKEYRYFISEKH